MEMTVPDDDSVFHEAEMVSEDEQTNQGFPRIIDRQEVDKIFLFA